MNITQVPSQWFGYPTGIHGRSGNGVQAVVIHIMSGSLAGCDAWFRNPTSEVSAHYGVGKDGSVHQYVDEGDTAYAVGILNRPDTSLPWLPPLNASAGRLVNQRTVSIETEGQSGDVPTEAQYAATLDLVRGIVEQWNVPVDPDHIVGHYRLDSVNRAGCPGAGFPWDRMFADLAPQPIEHLEALPPQEDAMAADAAKIQDALDNVWAVSLKLDPLNSPDAQTLRDKVTVIKAECLAGGIALRP